MAIPVVVGLLLRNRQVLMCERPHSKIYPLHWEFPGGKVEMGETLEQALIRELREELEVQALSITEYFHERATYSNGMTYDITYYLIREFTGEPRNMEFNRIAWIDDERLPTLTHLSGNEKILERLYAEGIPK